ncbi:hypothetical protein [Evansella halocellulosilytica]|uniref:hypothetical protein n=1 Tax=Evansella halocellulosilytica TaxID=2011013 RepID=UPI000BB82FBF|nr:hypothetical protein [Evansella halocellulosilytica]
MNNEIGKFTGTAGIVVIVAGIILSLIIGFTLNIVPAETSITGRVLEEAIPHPFRWFYAGGLAIFTTIMGLVLVGISGIIQEVERVKDGVLPQSSK